MTSTIEQKSAEVIKHINKNGGNAFLVGGCVRDLLLDIEPKDIDIEVYQLPEETLEKVLSELGKVKKAGKSFGVWKLHFDGIDFDISLPRKETKIEEGHKGFSVVFDPDINMKEAAKRRDFTINAVMYNPVNESIYDFFNGTEHLFKKDLRIISANHFGEDPLRPLRGMQFCGRFDMSITSEEDMYVLSEMFDKGEWKTLPKERIWEEWYKWAEKSVKPGAGIRFLQDSGYLRMFPELEALEGLEQDPKWHPEGDALTHTILCVDKMQEICEVNNISGLDKTVLIFSALCHDLGKPSTTKFEDGRIRSKGHASEGEEPTRSFLDRIGAPEWLVSRVVPLVVNHMSAWAEQASTRAVRRLARRLQPSTIRDLWMIIQADHGSRPPLLPIDSFGWMADTAKHLGIIDKGPDPILKGRHLIELGVKPGPAMGEILASAFEAQLDGIFSDVDEAINWFKNT